jgi:hypothetical protein
MFSKDDITKIARKILKRQRGLRDHQMIHPVREWTIGLIVAVLFLIIGGGWSFVTYQELSSRDVQNVEAVEIKQSGYRPETINSALQLFRERIEQYQVLTTSPLSPLTDEQPIVEEIQTIDVVELEPENDVSNPTGVEVGDDSESIAPVGEALPTPPPTTTMETLDADDERSNSRAF